MFRILLVAALATTALAAQEAPIKPADDAKQENIFTQADTDADGVLTLQEIKDSRRDRLTDLRNVSESEDPAKALEELDAMYGPRMGIDEYLRFDKDDDGRLTRAEYDTLAKGELPAFSEKDAEVLGDLTYSEWSAFVSARGDEFKVADFSTRMEAARRVQRTRAGDDLKLRYTMTRVNSNLGDYRDVLLADANDDGMISRAESRQYWTRAYEGKFDDKLGDADTKLFNEQRFGTWTSALDSNDDGVLTRDEVNNAFDAPDDAAWKKLDADNDGRLDRNELGTWEMPGERRMARDLNRTPATPRTPRAPESPEAPKTPKAPGTK